MMWFCIEPMRRQKSGRIMIALFQSWPGDEKRLVYGPPPDDGSPFVIWGQRWTTEAVLPKAIRTGRQFWYIDNGFMNPANGRETGYHRITYKGMTPILMDDPEPRLEIPLAPWRGIGWHIVLALPGDWFGRSIGFDMPEWIEAAPTRVRSFTKRRVLVRPKGTKRPLENDLRGAWALVTHSSNAAVDAVRMGIPVFVEPTSAAAPVGNLDLGNLENPEMPDRQKWWRSLMNQQFTVDEMANGTAWRLLSKVSKQVDGK